MISAIATMIATITMKAARRLLLNSNLMISDHGWERGVRTRALLKPESWPQIFTPVILKSGKAHPYGFAWEIGQKSGQTVHSHDGSFQGFEAILTRYIEEELTIIALANLAKVDLEQVTQQIVEFMRQEQ